MGFEMTLNPTKRIVVERHSYYPRQLVRPLPKPLASLRFVDGESDHVYVAKNPDDPGCPVNSIHEISGFSALTRYRENMVYVRSQLLAFDLLLARRQRRPSWVITRLFCIQRGVSRFVCTGLTYTLGRWSKWIS